MLKVVASAIYYEGIIYTVPAPGRHHDVFALMRETLGTHEPIGEDQQGFLLSDGRFARRTPSGVVALRAGQIKKLKWPPRLYSEDIWPPRL